MKFRQTTFYNKEHSCTSSLITFLIELIGIADVVPWYTIVNFVENYMFVKKIYQEIFHMENNP